MNRVLDIHCQCADKGSPVKSEHALILEYER